MHFIQRVLTYFFVTLGVLFFCLLIGAAYLWFADPFGIRPLLRGSLSVPPVVSESAQNPGTAPSTTGTSSASPDVRSSATSVAGETDKHPALDDTQEALLERAGIDPATLPTQLTPGMEACFNEKLGSVRVAEIKNGSTPTPLEFISARACLSVQ